MNQIAGTASRYRTHGGRHARVRACALIIGLSMGMVSMSSWVMGADQPLQTTPIGYQSGTITAVYQTAFQIDGRTYSFTSDAVIADQFGHPVDAGALMAALEAKFHVKKEQNDKIDKMILFLPR